MQLEQLRTLLQRVTTAVPFYKERIDSTEIASLKDLRRLPFTTKSDLRDNYPLAMLAVPRESLQRIHASSGTRNKPTIAAYTANDLAVWADLCARSLACAGVKKGAVLHNSYGYGLFTGGLGIHAGAEKLGATVVPASAGRTEQQILLLNDLRATVLCCTPSYAMNIAMTMEEQRTPCESIVLRIGIFGAEPWTEPCRRQLEQRLKIKAYDIYGLSEIMGPGVAMECQAQSGLHVWEDHFIAEIIDPNTGVVLTDGERGELVLTTLTKEALPLIRYRTGDLCTLISEPCECGRTMKRISRLHGRIDDMLIIRGVNVYPSEIEDVLYCVSGISPQYQIVIERDQALDTLTIRAELDTGTEAIWKRDHSEEISRRQLEIKIEDALRQRLGLSAVVLIMDPHALPRSEGKAFRVLDLRDKS